METVTSFVDELAGRLVPGCDGSVVRAVLARASAGHAGPRGRDGLRSSTISGGVVRAGAGHISDDIAAHGSRVSFTARPDSDLDIAVRVDQDRFTDFVGERFGTPNPGSAKERTMQHALETGKVQAGEAGLRGVLATPRRRSTDRSTCQWWRGVGSSIKSFHVGVVDELPRIMMTADPAATFERRMQALLASMATHVEAWALEEPRELLDAGEWGVAFDIQRRAWRLMHELRVE